MKGGDGKALLRLRGGWANPSRNRRLEAARLAGCPPGDSRGCPTILL